MNRERVLVLNPYDLGVIPVVEWLSERFDVLLVASRNSTNDRSYSGLHQSVALAEDWLWVDELYNDDRVVSQAERWHRHEGVDHVVCLDERGLVFAAQLREHLDVATGQRVESARTFRQKPLMYAAASEGVAVPPFSVAGSSFELRAAIDGLGLPVVVKPCDGAGSQDTFALHSPADVVRWLSTHPVTFGSPFLAQRYIEGRLFHVDGLTWDREVYVPRVSRYGSSTLTYHDSVPLTAVMLDPASDTAELLVDATRRALAAMPDTGGSSFHAELFLTDAGQVHLCEVASRTGGPGVAPSYEIATGLNLFREHALLQCGVRDPLRYLDEKVAVQPGVGYFLQRPPRGRLLSVPPQCDLAGVSHYEVLGHMGRRYGAPTSSVDAVQSFIIRHGGEQDAERVFATIERWCTSRRIVVDDPASAPRSTVEDLPELLVEAEAAVRPMPAEVAS